MFNKVYTAPRVANTGITNATVDFSSLPDDVRAAFLTGMKNFGVFDNTPTPVPVKKVRLPSGFKLYKFTEYGLKGRSGITPWWSPEDDYENDPGLEQRKSLARALGTTAADLTGVYAAVREDWNALTYILKARLKRPVYAFFGQCAAQPRQTRTNVQGVTTVSPPRRIHGPTSNIPGYAWQFYIPNLTDDDIEQTDRIAA